MGSGGHLSISGILIAVLIICVFAIVGGCLMGLSEPPQFPAPMFCGGYAMIMIDVVIICICVTWIITDEPFAILFVAVILIFTIIGGSLMGIATPPEFPTPMFIAGFVFIMMDALVIVLLMLYGCLAYI